MKASGRPTSVRTGILPTKERHQHTGGLMDEIIDRDNDGKILIKRYRARWENPLDYYRSKNLITETQYRVGLKFSQIYYGAVHCRKTEFKPTSKTHPLMEPTMTDKLLHKAYEVMDSEDVGTVVEVCGFGGRIYSPLAYEKLRKGLGQLSLKWLEVELEICEPKPKEA